MRNMLPPPEPEEYRLAWICALPRELAAAQAVLDQQYPPLPVVEGDKNRYTLGRIGPHPIVMVCLPAGKTGITNAAVTVTHMRTSFRCLTAGLMVGIGGGAPSAEHDIRLGDVVVGRDGFIKYDRGKTRQGGEFEYGAREVVPPPELLSIVSQLQAQPGKYQDEWSRLISQVMSQNHVFESPSEDDDVLFQADYDHFTGLDTCDQCDPGRRVLRKPRADNNPRAHYGLIGSADQVMRHAGTRDTVAQKCKVMCFEMEAGGVPYETLPCLSIRGICDYSDSHKNKQWQDYAAMTAATFAKQLLTLLHPFTPPEAVITLEPCFLVPVQPLRRLIGREDVLAEMHNRVEQNRPVLLHGLGGVGKTQLAVHFSKRYQEQHRRTHVLWVDASSPAHFDYNYRQIATALGIPGHEDPGFDAGVETHRHLARSRTLRWLMVVDNLDNVEQMAARIELIPAVATSRGRLVVTTRNRNVCQHMAGWDAAWDDATVVHPLQPADSINLLTMNLRLEQRKDPESVERLVKILDNLPLAVTQAIAWIKVNGSTVTKYLDCLDSVSTGPLIHLDGEFNDTHRYGHQVHSIYRTWELSFGQIWSQESPTAHLLAIMAMFSTPHGIPMWLVDSNIMDKVETTKALGSLYSWSFVENKSDETLTMHRMVRNAVRHFLHQRKELQVYEQAGLGLLIQHFPASDTDHWERCETLVPLVEELLSLIDIRRNDCTIADDRATLLHILADYEGRRGRYKEAHAHVADALRVRSARLGPDHLDTIASEELLALIWINQGRYRDALDIQQRIFAKRQAIQGTEAPATVGSQKQLGDVELKLGRFNQAVTTYQNACRQSELALGEKNRHTLEVRHVLAEALEYQKRAVDAEDLYRHVLADKQDTLGFTHPSTIQTRIALEVLVASRTDDPSVAFSLYQRMWNLSAQTFGDTHPDTIGLLTNQAAWRKARGALTDAETLQSDAWSLSMKVLGENHPSTLMCLSNLAVIKQEQGKLADAERIHFDLRCRRTNVLGPEHPHTLSSLYHLAEIKLEQGNYVEAHGMLERVVSSQTLVFGSDHPTTLRSMSSLTHSLEGQHRYTECEQVYHDLIDRKRRVLGSDHRETIVEIHNLAELLREQNRLVEAEALHREALQLSPSGRPRSLTTILIMANLARVLMLQHKRGESRALYESALADIRQMSVGTGLTKRMEEELDQLSLIRRLASLIPAPVAAIWKPVSDRWSWLKGS
ncbi:hypothetical protein AbraIFM66950_006619 [Aspergillus brasiliensis]|nr:hypothetical protein AbraIFM66950_006619 [Aspergillus brasiliensis]